LWKHPISDFMPEGSRLASWSKQTYFGALYQKLLLVR
jgi:hypothetical protein